MTHMELSALENSARTNKWSPEGYDGRTHALPLLAAFLPAMLIVAIAAFMLQSVL